VQVVVGGRQTTGVFVPSPFQMMWAQSELVHCLWPLQEMIPQHNYRLTAAALSEPRFGEVSCREYRDSVLRALPHSWTGLTDTRMHAARFMRHRESRGSAKEKLAEGSGKVEGMQGRGGAGHGGKRGDSSAQGAVPKAAWEPNVLVAHTEEGLDVVNLFSGACLQVSSVFWCCCLQ
jgi:hypothetical protein